MKKLLVLLIIVLAACYGGCWVYNKHRPGLAPGYHTEAYTPEQYLKVKDSLRLQREALAASFAASHDRKALVESARKTFISAINDKLFPYWYGTPWEFHGTSEVPGQGSIACGYFVTTVLRDAGVKIDRVKLAQCASEEMIKTLVPAKSIKRFSNVPVADFVKAVQEWGDGVYVVGLDYHTGFVICSGQKVSFVHSGGGAPLRVLSQKPEDAKLLANSSYRVLAKLSGSETFLQKWVNGETFK